MSPWVGRLTSACSSLTVDVVEGETFLGRGAFGRVFKVTREGQEFALKLVETCSVGNLYQEEMASTKAQHTGVTISAVKFIDSHYTSAFLLSPVGKLLPRPTTRQDVRILYELLWNLHASGLIHGDPRVPNVILVDKKKLLWIDLVETIDATPTLKQVDAEILTRSILRADSVNPELGRLIDN